jgi:predicted dehydrogenase
MVMQPVRLCLLGAGRWGKRYISTIADMAEVKLVALASRNPQSSDLVGSDCRIYGNWREAVNAPDIDAIIVVTPPEHHAEMALAAIAAGRPVLVEKPLTLDMGEAQMIADAAAKSGVMVCVGHIHLHSGGYREVKRRLAQIGRLLHIRAAAGNWGPFRADITPLWDWAPHDLYLCMDLAGRAPFHVTCDASAPGKIDGGWAGNYVLDIDFGTDLTANIRVGNMMPEKTRRLEIEGSEGVLTYDDVRQSLTLSHDGTTEKLSFSSQKPLERQIATFAAAVRAGRLQDPTLQQGVDSVSILHRAAPIFPTVLR